MSESKINDQTLAESQPSFGREPIQMTCPHCSKEMRTEVKSGPSSYAWIAGIALACVG